MGKELRVKLCFGIPARITGWGDTCLGLKITRDGVGISLLNKLTKLIKRFLGTGLGIPKKKLEWIIKLSKIELEANRLASGLFFLIRGGRWPHPPSLAGTPSPQILPKTGRQKTFPKNFPTLRAETHSQPPAWDPGPPQRAF